MAFADLSPQFKLTNLVVGRRDRHGKHIWNAVHISSSFLSSEMGASQGHLRDAFAVALSQPSGAPVVISDLDWLGLPAEMLRMPFGTIAFKVEPRLLGYITSRILDNTIDEKNLEFGDLRKAAQILNEVTATIMKGGDTPDIFQDGGWRFVADPGLDSAFIRTGVFDSSGRRNTPLGLITDHVEAMKRVYKEAGLPVKVGYEYKDKIKKPYLLIEQWEMIEAINSGAINYRTLESIQDAVRDDSRFIVSSRPDIQMTIKALDGLMERLGIGGEPRPRWRLKNTKGTRVLRVDGLSEKMAFEVIGLLERDGVRTAANAITNDMKNFDIVIKEADAARILQHPVVLDEIATAMVPQPVRGKGRGVDALVARLAAQAARPHNLIPRT